MQGLVVTGESRFRTPDSGFAARASSDAGMSAHSSTGVNGVRCGDWPSVLKIRRGPSAAPRRAQRCAMTRPQLARNLGMGFPRSEHFPKPLQGFAGHFVRPPALLSPRPYWALSYFSARARPPILAISRTVSSFPMRQSLHPKKLARQAINYKQLMADNLHYVNPYLTHSQSDIA